MSSTASSTFFFFRFSFLGLTFCLSSHKCPIQLEAEPLNRENTFMKATVHQRHNLIYDRADAHLHADGKAEL